MNKIIGTTKGHILNQKKKYIFLLTILLFGVLSGILFIFFVSNKDKSLIEKTFDVTFNSIKNNNINYLNTFFNSISSNVITILSIYILGISVIDMPIITIILFIKGFILGFSMSSIISIYHFKGIKFLFCYLFPQSFVLIVIWLLLGFHAISFSIKLFRFLFLKENIFLSKYFKNLNRILLISFIGVLICSLLETFLSPLLVDLCV